MRKLLPSLMLVFLSLYSIVAFSGCFDTPKEPVMPNWDVEMNIPITEKEYKVSELLDTSKNIKIVNQGGDDLYVILVDDIKNTFVIQDDIYIPFNPVPKSLDVNGSSENGQPVINAIIYNPKPESHISQGLFKSGSIKMNLQNNGSNSVHYDLIMPGFKNIADNSLLIYSGEMAGNSTLALTIPLDKYKYSELPIMEGLNDTKNYTYQAAEGFFIVGKATPVSGDVDVAFKSDVTSDKITIKKIVGRVEAAKLSNTVRTVKTDLGNDISNFTQVNFKEMSMTLNTHTFGEMSNTKIKLDSLSIVGYKKSKSGQKYSPVSLLLNNQQYYSLDIIAGEQNQPVTFDNNNSNLQSFIRNLPQVIELRSTAILTRNHDDAEQVISSSDSINFVISINAPLKISATDATFQDTINVDDEINNDDREDIVRATKASITLNIENHIPLGAWGKARFVDEHNNFLFAVHNKIGNTTVDSLFINPASVNADGIPTAPSNGNLTLYLEKDDIQKFKIAKYILVDLHMRTSPGSFVKIRPSDFIKIKLFGGVNYHVDPED